MSLRANRSEVPVMRAIAVRSRSSPRRLVVGSFTVGIPDTPKVGWVSRYATAGAHSTTGRVVRVGIGGAL